ncbi:hypothetical protein [Legionella micdadei]|uniref:Uncharacterized protein n=1 Tax=Legionella micdadei TaxID=451 RepID=A0A098GIC7_LEGMI|nr:hypothetical protein [Legionella micdadei]ARG96863.1 hypothetical protein B6N58_03830 [Legionella micdadei]ARG99597.1 hypothetical protein B6V88_03745 [Legionella micdadei]KTD26545.1 hypothetical protein Lmic_2639 [Legionella micdadei]NSL17865.1 hypothetical protein [Legionella micdadei]CEG61737.1 protein of unknown function [Legionella micdadei]
MKTRTEGKPQISSEKLDDLIKEVHQLMQLEKQEIINKYFTKIVESCSNESVIDRDSVRELFKTLYGKLTSEDDKKWVKDTWNNQDYSLEEKLKKLAIFLAKNEEIPSQTFIGHMGKFFGIINNNSKLNLFLKDPQDYIFNNPDLSAHDRQILAIVINDPKFKNLPSVHEDTVNLGLIYTPLTSYMYQLRADTYGSMDALRFPQCINPDMKELVIEKSKKEYYGPKVMGGMGAQENYDRSSIAETASKVKTMKMGACHTFAQLAADHLLTLMDEGKLPKMGIKIVSHNQSLGSHTFLLVGHKSDDLTDLSNCLIVDPWAVAMGYGQTYGIFTEENYPYPGMTTNLECCYDSEAPVVSIKKASSASQSLSQELSSALARGFFSGSRAQSEEKLSKPQRIVIEFLTDLMDYADNSLHNQTKKELAKTLIDSVKSKEIEPGTAIQLATLAMHARAIEKDGERYKWRGTASIPDESFVAIFNKSAAGYWKKYVSKNISGVGDVDKIDSPLINKIVKSLDTNIEHEFSQENTLGKTL